MKSFITLVLTLIFSIASWAATAVNINTASAEEIASALKGVGMSKAEAIVVYREINGTFMHIDELVNVKGIGIRTVDLNREVITLKGENELASGEK
ncbi:MAG: competence protein ComEA [Lysobacterales bacterium]|jgi:competence protein ComEA